MAPRQYSNLLIVLVLSVLESCGAERPRVVIVGAGVSGLGAAVRLLDHGFHNIKILEAEGRIGGRVHSVNVGNWTVDYGAHWILGGVGNPVYDLAEPLGLVDESGDDNNFTTHFSDGKAYPGIYYELFPSSRDYSKFRNISLQDALYNRTKLAVKGVFNEEDRAESLVERMMRMECVSHGSDNLTDVSARLVGDLMEMNGSYSLGWKGKGYESIVDLLLRRHEKSKGPAVNLDGKLLLNKEVKKIRVDEKEVVVECSDGTTERADVVLVTVSVGVLKAEMDSLFQPPLPQPKRAAIDAIGIGTVDKVILRFPTRWWPAEFSGFCLVWLPRDKAAYTGGTEWEKEIMMFAAEQWSPYTLTSWMVGEAAREMEKTPLAEVQEACMRVLRHFLGTAYDIPQPVEVIRSTWGTNPHFRGSNSYRRMQAETVNISKIADPLTNTAGKQIYHDDPCLRGIVTSGRFRVLYSLTLEIVVVFFGGEATHPYFYSMVQGALASGWREADRIIALHKDQL